MPRPSNLDSLGGRLAHARKKRGLTQDELEAASGVGQPQISKLERGDNLVTSGIARLAIALRIPSQWLELGEGPEPDWGKGSADAPAVAVIRQQPVSLPLTRSVTISGNLDTPEGRLLVRLVLAAKLPGVNVEVQKWPEKSAQRQGKTMGGNGAVAPPAKIIKGARTS